MKNDIAATAALVGIVSLLAQGLIAIASGGYSVGTEVHNLKSEVKLIRKDLKAQGILLEYRLAALEKRVDK